MKNLCLVLAILSFASVAPAVTLSSPRATSPRIDSISASTLARAGRLRIFGADFGAIKGASQVLIDGAPAPVSRWSDTLVVAYVPATAQIGSVPVQVVTSAGSSKYLQLDVSASHSLFDVTSTQANGSIKWQFQVDGNYMAFRPTIGPDGTIYVQDDNGHLYALRPDGSVKWIFQGGYPSGPVAVGTDNTTYVASDATIQAISPSGTLVWQFTDPGSQGVIAGPAVGPDGKIYAAMDLLGLGAIALSPTDGHLVWSNLGNPQLAEYGQLGLELVFGPASPGAQSDQFYFTCDNYTTAPQGHLYAFSLNGEQRWAVPAGGTTQTQTAVLPNGTISFGVAALTPSNGAVLWSAYSALGSGSNLPTDVGPDGTVYVIAQYQSALAALNGQNGAVLWRVPGVSFEEGPAVSPLNDVVVAAGRTNYGLPGYFKAFSTSGQFLWQINLPGAPYPGTFEYADTKGRFSTDGATVYMGTGVSGLPPGDEHCFLYAIQTAPSQTCSSSMSLSSESFTPNGGGGSVDVIAGSTCGWTASSNMGWVTIISGGNGTGNGTVNYSVAPNAGSSIRNATITIGGNSFTVYQGITFADVSPNDLFYTEIGKLSARGVTLGCGGGNYCPNDPVTREQMAAFILRAKGEFNPPTPVSQRFGDVPPTSVFYNLIDRLAALGITVGCQSNPSLYCPSDPVSREQMAAFIVRGLGEFNPPIPPGQRFGDVPSGNTFYNFVDRLAVLNITLGCTPDHLMYCPNDSVTRAQMAAFLVRAFNL
jgi:hypothetical protein